MRKFYALAALVLGLASCQQDVDTVAPVGGEVDFQLSVAAPELVGTRAGENGAADTQNALDSAFGAIDYLQGGTAQDDLRTDWSDVNLRYTLEVYDKADSYVGAVPVKDRQVIIVDEYKPVVFDLRLIPNRNYHFVVFADFVPQGVTDETHTSAIEAQRNIGLHHIIGTTLADIKVKEDGINDECSDAYFAAKDITITNSAAQDIVLKRPYGKVRVIATDLHELNLNANPVAVKVEYTTTHLTNFNAVTGIATGDKNNNEKVFVSEYNAIYKEVDKGGLANHFYTADYDALEGHKYTTADGKVRHTHMTLFTDYILASAEGQTPYHFTMKVYDNAAMTSLIKETAFTTDIPVERNKLTTVIGNVLTTATEIEVRIDDNFAGENEVDADIKDQLEEAAKYKNYVIDLDGDLIWETGGAHGSTPLIPDGAVTETLTINGNGYKVIATGAGVGPIRMANGGKLIFNDVTLVDQTKSYAENAWEFGYLEVAGNLEFNDCVIDNTIAIDGEKAVFNNCTFNDKVFAGTEGQEYAAWVSNGEVEFNGCKFSGARGIKVHEAYGSEVAEVVVDNCQFNNLSKKPGMAIGTVNAATKIEIKNSVFNNCQPGDQGLFMYETDTNVATFDFSQTNNTVNAVVTTQESLEKLLKSDLKEINVTLEADASINVQDAYIKLGGANTERIIIDGKKLASASATGAAKGNHKLTLATTYWSRLNTVNPDAVLVLKNLALTSSQETGTWNSYDVTLNCNVELENVELLKAVAFDGAGKSVKVKNVTIKESHDYYAMWIAAAGQTVDVENLVIESAGRGIKIDDQYVDDAVAKVTLNIDGLKVKSQSKAAIMVKSTKGADINIKNIDITEVAADNTNAVWVDEDAADYAALVNVTGASMVVEGQEAQIISTKESLKTALEAAGAAGAGNTTLILAKDAEIDMTDAEWTPIYVNGYNGADIVTVVGNGATLKGLTAPLFKGGFAGGSGIVIRDLTITESNIVSTSTQGSGAFIECVDSMETITLENCHFTNSSISGSRTGGLIGWTSGYSNENDGPVKTYVTIKDCSVINVDINATGSAAAINGHAGASDWTYTTIENCTVKDCNINSTDSGSWRTGVVVGTANVGEVTISNITESGNTLTQTGKTAPEGEKRNYYGRFVPGSTGKLIIDGEEVVMINTAEKLVEAINNAKAGDTITIAGDITLTENVTIPAGVTFNGNGKQINGTLIAGGDIAFAGHTKVTAFSAGFSGYEITIGEGACLEITGGGRSTMGYNNTFNITGTITDAESADKANIQPSLIMPAGISITGGNGLELNIKDAYVQIGSTTSKNSAANGTFTINIENSIAEFTNQLTFSEPTSGKNPTFNLNVKDSVITTAAKLILAAPNCNMVVDNSTIDVKTYFRNSGNVELKNGSVLTGSTIQFGENGGHDGKTTVDASKFTINASSTGHAYDGKGTGSITLKNGAEVNVDYYKALTINSDATSTFTGTEVL